MRVVGSRDGEARATMGGRSGTRSGANVGTTGVLAGARAGISRGDGGRGSSLLARAAIRRDARIARGMATHGVVSNNEIKQNYQLSLWGW